MKYPAKLQKGDTVGLICPSSPVGTERIAQCVSAVSALGYQVKLADNLDEVYAGYIAGSGKTRGEWVNRMFADPEVKGIFCIRGGDGSSRLMEFLDYDVIRNNPKIFVGYSDVTNLHLAINQNCDLVTFHGPMVSSNIVDDFDGETRASFFAALDADGTLVYKSPAGTSIRTVKEGRATGQLTGGNLSLLSASIGTPYEMDTRDKIIFIEEVAEPMSKIEKWAYHLRNAGKFKECRGVLLGQFTRVENEDCPEFDEICTFSDVLCGLDIPVMSGIASGHGSPMMTLPMGAVCTMDTQTGEISFRVERA